MYTELGSYLESIWRSSLMQLALICLAGLSATISCRMPHSGEPVPVAGDREAASRMAGEWSGRYWSKDTGRRGSIRFTMPERADTGYGEVEMTFSPALKMAQAASCPDKLIRPSEDQLDPEPCTFLNIRVVEVEDDRVRGTLDSYWDPDCNCQAQTIFEGKISGNRITGTYVTRRGSTERRLVGGDWQVDRDDS